jgi:hypothetical protein
LQQNWQQQPQQSSVQSSSNLLEQRQGPNTVAQQSASVGPVPQRQQQIPTIEEQQAIQYYISKLSPEQFKQLNTSVLQRLDDTVSLFSFSRLLFCVFITFVEKKTKKD